MDHQISARLEKDPARRKMFMNSSINLTDKSATEKGSNFFGQLVTFLVAYNLISGFLHYLYYNIIYYNPDIGKWNQGREFLLKKIWDPKNASSAVSNELLDLNREIMAIRYVDCHILLINKPSFSDKNWDWCIWTKTNLRLRAKLLRIKSRSYQMRTHRWEKSSLKWSRLLNLWKNRFWFLNLKLSLAIHNFSNFLSQEWAAGTKVILATKILTQTRIILYKFRKMTEVFLQLK